MSKDKRVSNIEKERRIRSVLSWILADALTHEIVEQCTTEFGISERMAYIYIKEAKVRIKDISDKDIGLELDLAVAKRKRLIRQLGKEFKSTPSGVRTILKIEDSISKLKGQFITKVDVTTKGKPVLTDKLQLPNLSTEEIIKLIEERTK